MFIHIFSVIPISLSYFQAFQLSAFNSGLAISSSCRPGGVRAARLNWMGLARGGDLHFATQAAALENSGSFWVDFGRILNDFGWIFHDFSMIYATFWAEFNHQFLKLLSKKHINHNPASQQNTKPTNHKPQPHKPTNHFPKNPGPAECASAFK